MTLKEIILGILILAGLTAVLAGADVKGLVTKSGIESDKSALISAYTEYGLATGEECVVKDGLSREFVKRVVKWDSNLTEEFVEENFGKIDVVRLQDEGFLRMLNQDREYVVYKKNSTKVLVEGRDLEKDLAEVFMGARFERFKVTKMDPVKPWRDRGFVVDNVLSGFRVEVSKGESVLTLGVSQGVEVTESEGGIWRE